MKWINYLTYDFFFIWTFIPSLFGSLNKIETEYIVSVCLYLYIHVSVASCCIGTLYTYIIWIFSHLFLLRVQNSIKYWERHSCIIYTKYAERVREIQLKLDNESKPQLSELDSCLTVLSTLVVVFFISFIFIPGHVNSHTDCVFPNRITV